MLLMSRLAIPSRDDAPSDTREALDAVHRQLGRVPGFDRLVASSVAAFRGYSALSDALAGAIDIKIRERVALAIAQENGNDYCLSEHNYRALNFARIGPSEIGASRRCRSSDSKAEAAMRFAVEVVRTRGNVADGDLADIREAGFSDPQIVELVAFIGLNLFSNFLNQVAETEIDFPVIRSAEIA
jgi:uncharacterized peroxidase-related enzyme